MDQNDRNQALELISDYQNGEIDNGGLTPNGTASITVEIGGTSDSNQVEHDTLYLHDACTGVIEALQDEGFKLSMSEKGLRVKKY